MIAIRPETSADVAAIHDVNVAAFGESAEAELVDALRVVGKATLSLVALKDGEVVGHVLFSPVSIETVGAGKSATKTALGLAPVAVQPAYQRHGIGSQLIRAGLDECRRRGHERVVVLGDPVYYRRFGFVRASHYGLRCEYDAPEEAFMALELLPNALTGCAGVVKYAPEFDAAEFM